MNSMNYIGKFISNFRDFYNEINTATLTGAIDVVVVEQPDGTFNCSPFHVRFGKLGVLRSREKVVDIEVNGEPLDIHMKLGESGEAFFVEELSSADLADEEIPPHLACSPIPCETFLSQHPLGLHDIPSAIPHANFLPEDLEGASSMPHQTFLAETLEGEVTSSMPHQTFLAETLEGEVTSSMPHKTFRAETLEGEVSKKVRRISLVSGEFRPIESDRLEAEMGVAKPTQDIQDSWTRDKSGEDEWNSSEKPEAQLDRCEEKWLEKPVDGSRPNVGATGKRKRRKKSVIKKKGGSKKGLARDVHDQQPSENIFVIDDLDQPSQPGEAVPTVTAPDGSPTDPPAISPLQVTENNFHFFSDTELSPESSPSPTQSDTELERVRHILDSTTDEGQNWPWGELPSPPRPLSDEKPINQELVGVSSDAQRSMLSGMFSFMKKTKRLRRGEGVYLADIKLDELDPEVAALYFPSSYHQHQRALTPGDDDDRESGNGTSLPHSPQSVEGAIGGPKHSDADLELIKHSIFNDNAAMSLCGGLDGPGPSNEAFMHGLVTYEDLCSNPKLLESPELVVRLGGKYYSWNVACSIVMSAVLYQRPLPQSALEHVCESPKDAKGGYASWFSWRRSVETKPAGISNGNLKLLENGHEQLSLLMENNTMNTTSCKSLDLQSQMRFSNALDQSDGIPGLPIGNGSNFMNGFPNGIHERLHRKTLRLSSEQIASLSLNEGANEVIFSVTTAYQGTTRCKCHIYKWRYDDRVVISDIDGTITKSDVLGHILPIVGKDWAQSGVAQLFTKIKNNGYKLLYLSARAIGQARVTREYLRSIKQGDLSLPDGPLLLNPTSLVSAFHREVIERKPEEFKISCLRDIQALFPADTKPFYAGYGNKVNDVWAYRAVGIPIFRIFTINHRGELKHELTQTFQSSYTGQSCIVNDLFPIEM